MRANAFDHIAVIVERHRGTAGRGIADMDVDDCRAGVGGAKACVGDLLGRNRQMWRLFRRGQVAGHRTGNDDFIAGWTHCVLLQSDRPPSTTKVVPVAKASCVAQARIAEAMSSAVAIRLSGVDRRGFGVEIGAAPGTKPVSTTPGATASTRIFGRESARERFRHHVDAGLDGAIGDRKIRFRCCRRSTTATRSARCPTP